MTERVCGTAAFGASLAFAVWKVIPATTSAATPAPVMTARLLGMRRCFNSRPPVGGGPGGCGDPQSRKAYGHGPRTRQKCRSVASMPVVPRPLFRDAQATHKVDFRTRVRQRPYPSYALTVCGHAPWIRSANTPRAPWRREPRGLVLSCFRPAGGLIQDRN